MTCTSFKHLLNIAKIYGTDLKGANVMNGWLCKNICNYWLIWVNIGLSYNILSNTVKIYKCKGGCIGKIFFLGSDKIIRITTE